MADQFIQLLRRRALNFSPNEGAGVPLPAGYSAQVFDAHFRVFKGNPEKGGDPLILGTNSFCCHRLQAYAGISDKV